MKKRNLFITLGLALAMGVGVGAGLSSKESLKADAIVPSEGNYTFYVNLTWAAGDFKTGRYSMYYFNDKGDGWVDLTATKVSNYYKAVIPATATTVIACGMNSGTSTNTWGDVVKQTHDIGLSSFDEESKNVVGVNDTFSYDKYGWWIDSAELQPELTSGDVYLRGNWSYGWADTTKKMTYVSENVYTIEDVLLSADSELKAVSIKNDYTIQWYDATDVVSESHCAVFDDPNVVVSETGSYDITVNLSTKVYTVEVSIDEDLVEAVDFADDFATQMALYCPITGSDAGKGVPALQSEWSSFKTRFLNDAQTSEQARTYLASLDDSTLNAFRAKYDSILTDYYSSLSSYDFLNRATTLGLSERVSASVFSSDSNSIVIIVATISAVSLLAVGGYFLLRRRKED